MASFHHSRPSSSRRRSKSPIALERNRYSSSHDLPLERQRDRDHTAPAEDPARPSSHQPKETASRDLSTNDPRLGTTTSATSSFSQRVKELQHVFVSSLIHLNQLYTERDSSEKKLQRLTDHIQKNPNQQSLCRPKLDEAKQAHAALENKFIEQEEKLLSNQLQLFSQLSNPNVKAFNESYKKANADVTVLRSQLEKFQNEVAPLAESSRKLEKTQTKSNEEIQQLRSNARKDLEALNHLGDRMRDLEAKLDEYAHKVGSSAPHNHQLQAAPETDIPILRRQIRRLEDDVRELLRRDPSTASARIPPSEKGIMSKASSMSSAVSESFSSKSNARDAWEDPAEHESRLKREMSVKQVVERFNSIEDKVAEIEYSLLEQMEQSVQLVEADIDVKINDIVETAFGQAWKKKKAEIQFDLQDNLDLGNTSARPNPAGSAAQVSSEHTSALPSAGTVTVAVQEASPELINKITQMLDSRVLQVKKELTDEYNQKLDAVKQENQTLRELAFKLQRQVESEKTSVAEYVLATWLDDTAVMEKLSNGLKPRMHGSLPDPKPMVEAVARRMYEEMMKLQESFVTKMQPLQERLTKTTQEHARHDEQALHLREDINKILARFAKHQQQLELIDGQMSIQGALFAKFIEMIRAKFGQEEEEEEEVQFVSAGQLQQQQGTPSAGQLQQQHVTPSAGQLQQQGSPSVGQLQQAMPALPQATGQPSPALTTPILSGTTFWHPNANTS